MTVLAAIANRSIFAFALLLWVAQMVAHEAGYWFGSHRRRHGGEIEAEGFGVVVGGMLNLLAFVLALTLSFANSRFSERVEGTLAEANAIGTAWLRAEAIGHPRGPETKLLEEYTRLRRDYVSEGRDQSAIDELNQRTNALQSKIWGHMAAILREQPNVVSTSLMTAINDAFDQATAERFAYYLRLPSPIFWLLLGMTLLGMAALGFPASKYMSWWRSSALCGRLRSSTFSIWPRPVSVRSAPAPPPMTGPARLQGRAPDPTST